MSPLKGLAYLIDNGRRIQLVLSGDKILILKSLSRKKRLLLARLMI